MDNQHNETPLISVVMPVYNGEEYLNDALQSVLNQTYRNFELIIINDGSTDKSLQIIEKYKKQDRRILLIDRKNKGVTLSLYEGIEKSNGGFIARMDQDDICLPSRFQDQMDYLAINLEVDVVGTWISEIDENNCVIKEIVKYPETHKRCMIHFKCRDPLAHPTVMFRKTFFDKGAHYAIDIPAIDDTLLWHRGFINGCVFANLPKVCLQFRRTSDMYQRRKNMSILVTMLKQRLFVINPSMNYGILGNACALLYFLMQLLPSFIKKILYDKLR
jgi:glycosyltransferase involved in cell wall biosynthesis